MLGTPWFHNNKIHIEYREGFPKFAHRGTEIQLVARKKGESIPLVNGVAVRKSIKSTVSVYLIYVKDQPVDYYAENINAQNFKALFLG